MNVRINEYNLLSPKSGPHGIVLAQDGGIWFAEETNKIGQLIY